MLNIFLKLSTSIVCTPFSAGGLSLPPTFNKGGLTGSRFSEGGCRKRGGDFFQQGEGLQFLHKK